LAEIQRMLAGDPSAAETRAREVLREAPDDCDALLLLAIALRKQNAMQSARNILERIVAARPHWPQAHFELGLVLGALGENLPATQALRAAVDLDPAFAPAWNALGDQMTRMRSKKGADAAYANAFYASVDEPRLRDALTALREGRLDNARELASLQIDDKPDDINAIKLLGEIESRAGRMIRAEELFRRCVELAPEFMAARFRYATVLMSQNKPLEAIAQVDELLKRQPREQHYRSLKAAALIRMSAFAEAAAEYKIMLEAVPNQPGAWVSYGHALKAIGRPQACAEAYKKAIALLPGLGESYWGLANLKTYRFSAEEIEAMRNQAARDDLSGDNRAQLLFALGRGLEDSRRFEDAFQCYAEANALVRNLAPYDAGEMTRHVSRSKALFTRPFFARRSDAGSPARDPIFVVGLPRSGSTLVEQILASHSMIEGTTELRAIPYLAGRIGGKRKPDDAAANYPQIAGDLDFDTLQSLGREYLWRARVHRKSARPLFVDKRPDNFAHIGLIHLILPNAKIVDVRRHPMACGLSNYTQHFGSGQAFSYGLTDIARYYRDYVELMAHFDEVLPGRIHRVLYERLVEDPDRETRALLTYLGLQFEPSCLRFFENDRVVRSASAQQVRQPIHTEGLDHWRNFEPWLGPLRNGLGVVLETYPAVPEFFDAVQARGSASWNDNGGRMGWNS
jgi:predicted Zn-dependent protease